MVTFTVWPTQPLQWTKFLLTFPVARIHAAVYSVRSPQNDTYGGLREGNAFDSFQRNEYKIVIIHRWNPWWLRTFQKKAVCINRPKCETGIMIMICIFILSEHWLPSRLAHGVTYLYWIREVSGLNLCWETNYHNWDISWLLSIPPRKCRQSIFSTWNFCMIYIQLVPHRKHISSPLQIPTG